MPIRATTSPTIRDHVIWFGASETLDLSIFIYCVRGNAAVDQVVIVLRQLARHLADLEVPRPGRRTGVTSTAVPVRNICSKLSSSSARSPARSPRCRAARARSITVRRVMPSRKQSGVGVCSSPSRDEEDVGAGRLGHPAAPVEHQRVVVAALPPHAASTGCRSCTGPKPWTGSARCRARAAATARCRGECPLSDLRGS